MMPTASKRSLVFFAQPEDTMGSLAPWAMKSGVMDFAPVS
eukprot:CAMPEP_0172864766 /NCGR_PEP_ID=MMETSP1075-20121228/81024_1 /TAXON_ID=2916 /ORGANISM="Ceratium fusus, Strain PA161109" /LENGTH=39 /DNA_ID= /DNA_START= /DNA_END= /DNA_ORIENTATION=